MRKIDALGHVLYRSNNQLHQRQKTSLNSLCLKIKKISNTVLLQHAPKGEEKSNLQQHADIAKQPFDTTDPYHQ